MGEPAAKSDHPLLEEEIERDVLITIENLICGVGPDAEIDETPICEEVLAHVLATVESQIGPDLEIKEKSEPQEEIMTVITAEEVDPTQTEQSPETEAKEIKIEAEASELSTTNSEESGSMDERNVTCNRCKASSSWLWRRSPSGCGFICTNCENRDLRLEEEQPPPKRTHRDSLVLNDGDAMEVDLKSADLIKIEAEVDGDVTSTPLPIRKSSRSTRSTLSNSNPYAYPRPVVSKPKEKKSITRNAPNYSSPSPVLRFATQVRYRGTYIRIGDIVSVRGHDGGIYYAQIRGLLEDQYCDKSAALTWLLPTQNSPPPESGFDPDTYILGMEEDVPRSLESMEFVMHAPSDYFKLQLPYGFDEAYLSSTALSI